MSGTPFSIAPLVAEATAQREPESASAAPPSQSNDANAGKETKEVAPPIVSAVPITHIDWQRAHIPTLMTKLSNRMTLETMQQWFMVIGEQSGATRVARTARLLQLRIGRASNLHFVC